MNICKEIYNMKNATKRKTFIMKNKQKKGLLFGLLICIIFTGCVSTYVANLQRNSDKEVEVFTTIKPINEYIELKYI